MPPRLPDAAAVLAGRARVSIEQLFALIHAVNPTDRGLSPREKSERYAVKSRLQSLLVRDHAEWLEVVEDGEGVVSVRHRIAGRDACHAVVASLDDDARRWVETQLALPAVPVTTPGREGTADVRRERSKPTDTLSRGRAALDAYDYEEARACFEAALPAAEAVAALVDLLVNHLALDEEALALVPRLGAVDPVVSEALALAAARAGDPRAEGWARASRAAEPWVHLAERAVRAGDAEQGARFADALRDRATSHPALKRLGEGIAGLRRDACAPLERALESATDDDEVVRIATEIRRRAPDHPGAREALRAVERRRLAAETQRWVQESWFAWERQDHARVVVCVARAREGVLDDETRGWLEEAEAAAREALEVRAVALGADAARVGDFLPYAALPPHARAKVRAMVNRPELAWIDRLGEVDAARAIVAALADPDSAPELLAPHARALKGVSEARRLVVDAEARRKRSAEERFEAALGEAEDAWLAGDIARARTLAATLEPGAGSADAMARHRELMGILDQEHAAAELRAKVQDRLDAADLLGARDLARTGGAALAALAEELSAQARAEWCVEVFDAPGGWMRDYFLPTDLGGPLVWLTPSGDAVFGCAYERWVILRLVDPDTASLRRVICTRVPVPLDFVRVQVDGDVVWLLSRRGCALALALADGEVRAWRPTPPDIAQSEATTDHLIVTSGGRYLWMAVLDGVERHTRVYDLAAWPSWRRLDDGRAVPLVGWRTPAVALIRRPVGMTLHAPNGTQPYNRMYFAKEPLTRVVVEGDGLLTGLGDARPYLAAPEHRSLVRATPGVDLEEGRPLALWTLDVATGRSGVSLLASTDGAKSHDIVVSRDDGRTYMVVDGDRPELITNEGDEQVGGIAVPRVNVLVTDAEGRRVRAFAHTAAGVSGVLLGDERIDVAEDSDPLDLRGIDGPCPCPFRAGWMGATARSLRQVIRRTNPPERRAWIEEMWRLHMDDPGTLFALACAAVNTPYGDLGNRISHDVGLRFPEHPLWRLVGADLHSRRREWDEVERQLGGLVPASFEPVPAQHLLHLQAMVALRAGEGQRAVELLGHARAIDAGACVLGPIEAFAAVVTGNASGGAVASYVDAIRRADASLAAGLPLDAVEALDTVGYWRANELQGGARMAEAMLALDPGEGNERVRRRVALANYAERVAMYEGSDFVNLPFVEAWPWARLVDVAERARGRVYGSPLPS